MQSGLLNLPSDARRLNLSLCHIWDCELDVGVLAPLFKTLQMTTLVKIKVELSTFYRAYKLFLTIIMPTSMLKEYRWITC